MNKKVIILSLIVLLIISSIIIFGKKNNKKYIMQDGILLAMTLTDEEETRAITSFPDFSNGKYTVNIECENGVKGDWKLVELEENGTITYEWNLVVEDITGNVSCNLDFKTANLTNDANKDSDYLNQYIKDNAVEGTSDGTNQAEGDIVHETFTNSSETLVDTGYRYEGKNPANYIWFNNELWRIIGVFETEVVDEDGNISATKKELTKIIREEFIGSLVWNKSSNNNWPDASLYKLLNPVTGDDKSGAYFNSEIGDDSGYCFGYGATIKGNCDYTERGLGGSDSYYGSMVENVVWYLGGISLTDGAENNYKSPVSNWYTYERGNIVYNTSKATQTTGYVGLMYGSDYGYSVKASSDCNRSQSLYNYTNEYCAGQSWLYNSYEWVITPRSDNNSYAMYVSNLGNLGNYLVYNTAYSVRPVIYLDEEVYIIKGTGTAIDPYIIGK